MEDAKYNDIVNNLHSSLSAFLMFWIDKNAKKEGDELKSLLDNITDVCIDFWQRKELLEKKAGINAPSKFETGRRN